MKTQTLHYVKISRKRAARYIRAMRKRANFRVEGGENHACYNSSGSERLHKVKVGVTGACWAIFGRVPCEPF